MTWNLTGDNPIRRLPDVYAEWERNENALREQLGEGAYILKETRDGVTRPLTLTQLRHRREANEQLTFDEQYDIGGCGCAID